jgi:DHA2 family multidrug resistance protein
MEETKSTAAIDFSKWIAFICMVFGMFMAILDIQIVASSLKEIQAGLSATQDEINWVQSSYLIAEVVVIPLTGWLVRVFSTKIVFSVSCAMFTLMSLACALAWDLNSMIMFRALQGLFGGCMIPTVFATIFILFPLNMRPMVTVVIGLVVTIAPIAGPVIGGYLTDYLSWHYLFLLNIIPGIIVTFSVFKLVNFDKPNYELLKNIDFTGIILISISLGCLQYVLEEGVREEWFDSHLISWLSFISFTSFLAMIYRELTAKSPIINLFAFRDRNFSLSCILSFILGWGMFSAVFIMPIYLGSIKGLNSLQIGQYLFVTGLFQLLSAPCAGILSKKIDLRLMLAFGLTLFGVGCFMNFNITHDSGFDEFFWPQAVRGFSLMFCFLPITSLAFATLPKEEVQTASGLYNLMRNLGGAIGLAVTNSWLQNLTKSNYLHFRENVDATNSIAADTLNLLEQNFISHNYAEPAMAAIKSIYLMAQREAYIITFNQVLTYVAFLFFSGVLIMPLIRKLDENSKSNDNSGH